MIKFKRYRPAPHCWFCSRRMVFRFEDTETGRMRWVCWRHIFQVRKAFEGRWTA